MGRTNDAIIYGGRVHLFVTGPADDAQALAERAAERAARAIMAGRSPRSSSASKGDFYAIDPMLFSPAEVIGDGDRQRPDLPRGRDRHEPARCLVRVIGSGRPHAACGRSPWSPTRSTGTRATSRGACASAARARRCVDLADCAHRHHGSVGTASSSRASAAVCPTRCSCARMSGGTFEAVTLRLGVLHALRELGVPVCNDARAIERCVDKSMTSFLLARAGIPTPPTWADRVARRRRGDRAARGGRRPAGAQAAVRLAGARPAADPRATADLPAAAVERRRRLLSAALRRASERDGFRDFRAAGVAAAASVAAMTRSATHWITNVKQGARPVAAVADAGDRCDLAMRAAAAVGADFAGVDILHARGRHVPHVLEVNSMPAWRACRR